LSQGPSRAQSHITYPNFDVALGVEQLQLMGVRYYMASSPEAVRQAGLNPDLTEVTIGAAGPWRVFLVAGSDLVEPLSFQPVVYSNVDEHQESWLDPAVEFFNNPDQWDVLRAASGPQEWTRWAACLPTDEFGVSAPSTSDPNCSPPQTPLAPVQVSNISWDDDDVVFDVDQIGVPVLVKISYFPNWKVSGGEGPYRVAPNLMVVIPTSNQVRLHYGYVGVDYAANVLTLLGIVALILLFRAKPEDDRSPLWDPVGRMWRRRPKPMVEEIEPTVADQPSETIDEVGSTDSRLE
jgi:hypothetical protein